MIVKDEEKYLGRCLKNVKDIFDEIIIVDTGSTDNTKNIAEKYTEKIYDFKWVNDFGKARNFAFSKAKKDYIMWLDADDVIPEEEIEKLKELKETMDKTIDIYMLKYNVGFDNEGNCNFSFSRERIIKNNKKYKWIDRVHEYIPIKGKVEYLDIFIEHKKQHVFSERNLKIYEEMESKQEKFSPRNLYYYSRELVTHKKYKKAIRYLNEFIEGNLGWIEDKIKACELLYECNLALDDDNAVKYLYKTFEYALPRSKVCCLIASDFKEKGLYDEAIYWYKIAIASSMNKVHGFYEKDYDEFIPFLNLVVCYDKLGKIQEAKTCHAVTKNLKPNHTSVIHNEKYFADLE